MLSIQEIITKLENITENKLPPLKIEAEKHFLAIDHKYRTILNHPGNLDIIRQTKVFNMFCLQEEKLRSDVANYGILFYDYIKEIYLARFLIKKYLKIYNELSDCVEALENYLAELERLDSNNDLQEEDKSNEEKSLSEYESLSGQEAISDDNSLTKDIQQIHIIMDESEEQLEKLYLTLKLIDDAMNVFAIKCLNNSLFAKAVYKYAECFDKEIIRWCDIWINHQIDNPKNGNEDSLHRIELAVKEILLSPQVTFKAA